MAGWNNIDGEDSCKVRRWGRDLHWEVLVIRFIRQGPLNPPRGDLGGKRENVNRQEPNGMRNQSIGRMFAGLFFVTMLPGRRQRGRHLQRRKHHDPVAVRVPPRIQRGERLRFGDFLCHQRLYGKYRHPEFGDKK